MKAGTEAELISAAGEVRGRTGSLSSSTGSSSPPASRSFKPSVSPVHSVSGNGGKKKSKFEFFSDRSRLDEHLVTNHRYPADQYKCELCPRAYSWRSSLQRHRALSHGEIRMYPCENCSKVYKEISSLRRHFREHHAFACSHACPECGKKYATSLGLKRHTHIHSKPFQCEVCFKANTDYSSLCRHKRKHPDCHKQSKCVKYGQSISTVTSLSQHKRFCDSITPSLGGGGAHKPPQHYPVLPPNTSSSMTHFPHPNPQHGNSTNTFLMYSRPPAGHPFYPPSHISPYPSIFYHASPHTSRSQDREKLDDKAETKSRSAKSADKSEDEEPLDLRVSSKRTREQSPQEPQPPPLPHPLPQPQQTNLPPNLLYHPLNGFFSLNHWLLASVLAT